jgi:hypothetical protein
MILARGYTKCTPLHCLQCKTELCLQNFRSTPACPPLPPEVVSIAHSPQAHSCHFVFALSQDSSR